MERNIASSISSTFEPGFVVGDLLILLRPRPAYCMAVGILPQRGRAVRDADATLAAKGLVRKVVGHLGLRGEHHRRQHSTSGVAHRTKGISGLL